MAFRAQPSTYNPNNDFEVSGDAREEPPTRPRRDPWTRAARDREEDGDEKEIGSGREMMMMMGNALLPSCKGFAGLVLTLERVRRCRNRPRMGFPAWVLAQCPTFS